ncbi:hypothetical protein QA601_02950 [Chitinispirillales bacterium ANBcel5]|uniref:hypothetical protein n=1 Tax=Cellulosispirillum alkaliphilum TaxID=3039283 RepID=UPI002A515402|nr:hypothetical protein [Chitinispirillales bacterium ANBcel5]
MFTYYELILENNSEGADELRENLGDNFEVLYSLYKNNLYEIIILVDNIIVNHE